MMVVAGGNEKAGSAEEQKNADLALSKSDPNRSFMANAIATSKAEKRTATRLLNLNMTIAQGKIIDAVLETAVNTDLPGQIRAIVSRDVFAEAGRDIMIPKGSRLIGVYNTSVTRGQVRVLVVWTRMIRPDGIDIQIDSNAADPLGRAGVPGMVDNKYAEIFSAAALTSIMDIAIAVAVDRLSNNDSSGTTNTQSSTTTGANGTTTSGSAASFAAAGAVSSIGSISKDIVNTMLDLKPTITIDQGTKLNVFVNKDLSFPGGLLDKQFVE